MWGSVKRQQDEAAIDVSDDTLRFFESHRQLEVDHRNLKQRYDDLTEAREADREGYAARLGERDREARFLKQQLVEAEAKRDRYAVRAIEAENLVRIVTSLLIEGNERIAAAESMEEQTPPRLGDVDLNADLADAVRNLPAVVRRGPASDEQ